MRAERYKFFPSFYLVGEAYIYTMSQSSDEDNDFFLTIVGSIDTAPFLEDWTKFKDDLRSKISGQPKWVHVQDMPELNKKEGSAILSKGDTPVAFSRLILLDQDSPLIRRH